MFYTGIAWLDLTMAAGWVVAMGAGIAGGIIARKREGKNIWHN